MHKTLQIEAKISNLSVHYFAMFKKIPLLDVKIYKNVCIPIINKLTALKNAFFFKNAREILQQYIDQ